MVLDCDQEVVSSVMDEILEYVDDEGIVMVCNLFAPLWSIKLCSVKPLQTYFDRQRPRIDPVVCVNALSLFYRHGRGRELVKTLRWVHEVLLHRAYLDGTYYYEGSDIFLFYLGRLLGCTPDAELHHWLEPLLKERIQERVGQNGSALNLAMRLLTCNMFGIEDQVDLEVLLSLQCEDGGWGLDWIYRYGTSGIKLGNRGVTTALAVSAIEVVTLPDTHLKSESVAVSREENKQMLARPFETQVVAG